MDGTDLPLTSTHWGAYRVQKEGDRVTALKPFELDPDPSPIGEGILDVLDGPTRITAPMVRKSWLEGGPGAATEKRGAEAFVEVSWEQAEKLVADELARVIREHGNQAIYAGSYGWASAGRFHHAQSQIHRFLNCLGGYTFSLNTYSFAAAEVAVPHILGTYRGFVYKTSGWPTIAEHTDLFVAFGGVPVKNGQISQGGAGRHVQRQGVLHAAAAGVEFVNISPIRSDVMDEAKAEWLAPRPSTDAALMLALAHTLVEEGLANLAFLDRYTVGFETYKAHLLGQGDGQVKSAEWAAPIVELPAETIRELARRMAKSRTMISVSWSLTRQDHGEQPFWAAIALAAMLGQIGLPGQGIGFGYSATNTVGLEFSELRIAALPQGVNRAESFIPVARVSDMLLNPGQPFDYNGRQQPYPDIRLVYWAGGNPFHHHQDLNRMVEAWRKPETIIAHEWCWNAHAKHADIVLPCTTALERNDLSLTSRDNFMMTMDRAMAPVGQARDDYSILSGVAAHLGVAEVFTEGRSAEEWIEWIYDVTRQNVAEEGVELPSLKELRAKGYFEVPKPEKPWVMMQEFREDPDVHPLKTPSGKIEIFSETVASYGYADCPGHPVWLEPAEWLGGADKTYPLHLISNQPANKLHSQLDHGAHSRNDKVDGREPITLHPEDAAARGIATGDVVRLFNGRGSCFASAVVDDQVRPGVMQLATGAWFDPADGGLCKHGNPNVLTLDKGTSRLAQGPIAHSCLVEIERFEGAAPAVTAYDPPKIIPLGGTS
ncbi:MAG: molybdopterin guanine dinucleotide-containing S/N-oxide reductase [Alphaproteobacteria bacterium]